MRKHYFLFIIGFFAAVALGAQSNRRSPSLAFGIQVSQPIGAFADNYDGYPVGLAGTFTGPLSNSPFEIGLGFAWNQMGAKDENVSVLMGQDAAGDDIYEEGNLRVRSNDYRYQLVGRFKPFKGSVQVYGDVMAGVARYTTFTDISISSSGYSEVIETNNQQHDFGWTMGWAAGARIRVTEFVFIDARFEKLEGGAAEYVDQESILVNAEEATIEFETKETRTDRYTYQLGIAIEF
jgi:Outer membrane protein beta-barrel domain